MFGVAVSFKEMVEFAKLNSHIEVIEQLSQKAMTWAPSHKVHVAELGPGELRTAHICAFITPLPSFQNQENTQANPAGLKALEAHTMCHTARVPWPSLRVIVKHSGLCCLLFLFLCS